MMWKLWNSVTRGLRCFVVSAKNGTVIPVDDERDVSKNFRHSSYTISSPRCQQFYSFARVNSFENFSLVLNPCVPSEWKPVHPKFRINILSFNDDKHSLLQSCVITPLCLPGCSSARSDLDSQTVIDIKTLEEDDKVDDIITNHENEVEKTMVHMIQNIEKQDTLRIGDLLNEAGVQLLSSASQEGNTTLLYDYLLPNKERSLTSNRLEEAVLCFKESRQLGSKKAAFNLGMCYEQGWGTSIDLNEAALCYKEAASSGHAGAMYNLGLLHYLKKMDWSDRRTGLGLFRQAAKQGLEEALLVLGQTEPMVRSDYFKSPSSSSSLMDGGGSSLNIFRKAYSEPHGFSLSHDELESSFYENPTGTDKTVSFYIGNS